MPIKHDGKIGVKKRIVFGGDANYPPFLFRATDGKPSGYHVDLIKAIADALDYQVDIQLKKLDEVMRNATTHMNLESGNQSVKKFLQNPLIKPTYFQYVLIVIGLFIADGIMFLALKI